MIALLVYGLSLLLIILALLWIFVPTLYGLPPVPTRPERIRQALKLANLQPNEVLYDLGAGDGRVLFLAAGEFGAKAVGIEVGPVQCGLIWLRIIVNGFQDKIRVKWANFYKADVQDANVVFVYATSTEVVKLASHLQKQLKKGTRVVSISADFPDWEPEIFDERDLIFVYQMPPTNGSLTTYLLKKAQ